MRHLFFTIVFTISIIFQLNSIAMCEQINARIVCEPSGNDYVICFFQNMSNTPIKVENFAVNRGNIKVAENELMAEMDMLQNMNNPNAQREVGSKFIKGQVLRFGDRCGLFMTSNAFARNIIEVEVNTDKGQFAIPLMWN